jgi:hypothetical protein
MALNLNKGSEQAPNSSSKKGLNLSKSGDSKSHNFNLSKENVADSQNGNHLKENGTPKNSLKYIMAIVLIAIIFVAIKMLSGNSESKNEDQPVVDTSSSVSTNVGSSTDTTAQTQAADTTTATDNSTVSSVNTSTDGTKDIPSKDSKPNTISKNNTKGSEIIGNSSSVNTSAAVLKGSIDEKAKQVISGAFGNGLARKRALGNEYTQIQSKVNDIMKQNSN